VLVLDELDECSLHQSGSDEYENDREQARDHVVARELLDQMQREDDGERDEGTASEESLVEGPGV